MTPIEHNPASRFVICPHMCSHGGSHCGVCMTCLCPTSTILGVPGTGPTYPDFTQLWR